MPRPSTLRTLVCVAAMAISVCVQGSGCAGPQSRARDRGAVGAAPKTVATILTGTFTSERQADEDPSYYPISLRHVPIWTDRNDGPWLYVEQALSSQLHRPYRQRVYHLVGLEGGRVRSDVYTLPGEALDYAGADPSRFDDVSPSGLEPRNGCSIFLEPGADGHFVGSTHENACKSTLRGAAYATSEVDLRHEVLTTWDRGYDENGEQVWGATTGPYRFERVDE